MSTKPNDGGPAYPVPYEAQNYPQGAGGYHIMSHPGMSTRAVIATQMLAALCSNSYTSVRSESDLIEMAVNRADALIARLEKE